LVSRLHPRVFLFTALALLSVASIYALNHARIKILEANASFIAVNCGSNQSQILLDVRVKSGMHCQCRVFVNGTTYEMAIVERTGNAMHFRRSGPSMGPGNHSLAFVVTNSVWSVGRRIALYVPASEETGFNWTAVHYGISNTTYRKSVDVVLYTEGPDAGEVEEVVLSASAGGAVTEYVMAQTSRGMWSGGIAIGDLGPVMYHFSIRDSGGKSLRVPASGQYIFFVKNPPMAVTEYLLSLRKSDGSFGPADQEHVSGLWWTYHALESLSELGYKMEWPLKPMFASPGDPWEIYQSLRLMSLTGRRPNIGNDTLSILLRSAKPWTREDELTGYFGPPKLSDIYYSLRALHLLNCTVARKDELVLWLVSRRNPDGGWGNLMSESSHVSFTYYAMQILRLLDANVSTEGVADFVRKCQNADGGYGWAPGQASDVKYTYEALSLLKMANADSYPRSVVEWLLTLQNPDGGFGCKPGWPSDVESTHLAIACFGIMGDLDTVRRARAVRASLEEPIDDGFHVYTAVLEAAGSAWGRAESPGYIVGYAAQAGIDLLGIKTSNMSFVNECRLYAREHGIPVQIVASDEQYAANLNISSIGAFGHVANIVGEHFFVFPRMATWSVFKRDIKRLHDLQGLIHLQTDYCPEFTIALLDDSVLSGDGYDAASFDLLGQPWTERYWRVLPMIYSADAHYDLWQTRHKYETDRTLFIARNNTWEGFLDAVRANRIVRVFLDGREGVNVIMVGRPLAVKYVRDRMEEWAWWLEERSYLELYAHVITAENSRDADFRSPYDDFALPQGGMLARVYNSTNVVSVWVDGVQQTVALVRGDSFWSPYLVCQVDNLSVGSHALVIWRKSGAQLRKEELFFKIV